ncbi:MAG: Gfo/Idh/MocA family oxidoreductase [Candidatus Aenigmatarchaeota archaeon]|nr:MAG: Gfo/Idh/MocA family oxidoreductase [Candidatus Aenigmarchaeota archaeon]
MRVGVIGAGVMGKNHARVYSEMDDVELVGIADSSISAGKTVAKKHGCPHYVDYKKFIEKEKPEAVSLCVPTSLHYKIAKDVIDRGLHLLVEKPITKSVKDAEELVLLAKKRGIKLAVGHIERFNPAVQELKKLIDRGKLGHVTSILARRVGLFPPRIKDANVIIDIAVHDIDVFRYLLGKEPEVVHASGGKAVINDREDYADIFMKYNGTNGFIEVNWLTPVKIRVLNVTGTKGYAQLNYISQDLKLYESDYKNTYDQFGEFVLQLGEPKEISVNVKKQEPLKLELQNFVDAVKSDKPPLVTGEDGLRVLKIAASVMDSIRR